MRSGRAAAAVTAMLVTVTTPAAAQDALRGPITVVVGFPAGGGTDLFARLFAQKLGPALGANVIVENRSGAAGTVGTAAVVRAAPTGQTLLFTPANIAMAQAIYPSLPFDPRRDLAPVTMTAVIAFALVVHPSLPVRTPKELIALARAKPGALDYGSSGPGSPPHFAMEIFKHAAGVSLSHIPYKGAGPILTAILSGEVQAAFLIPPVAKQYMDSGKLRGLAVSTRERSSALPALPSLHEAGLRDYAVTQWHAFFAPAKTPAPVLARLQGEIVKTLSAPEMKERLAAEGATVVGSSAAELATHLAAEIRLYTDVAQRLKLKPD